MPGSYKLSPSLRPLHKDSVCSPPLPHTCYMPHPSPWFYHPKSLFVIRSLLLQLHDDRTWACLAVRRRNNCIQYNVAVHELHRSIFRRFVTGSNESGWRTWLDSRFTLATVIVWITLSSVVLKQTLINIRQHNSFITRGYMFRPFKRSTSGLLTDWVNRRCVLYMLGFQQPHIFQGILR